MTAIRPFELAIPEDQLVALADRLDQTRWPCLVYTSPSPRDP